MIRYDKTNHEGMLSKSESKTDWGLVVVLGHILNINGTLYDLRMPESIYQIDSYPTNRKNTDINTNTPEGQMAWHINNMLEGWLPYEENWGDNETQWDLAINNAADLTLDSDWAAPLDDYNEALRAMAALAGKEPLKLCCDNEPWVRENCVQSLINDKKRGVVRDDAFLDTLIKHEDDPQVLAKIAEYGLVKHLDRLLPNASLEVMRQIAKHKIARHILAMSSHSDPLIRLLSVSYIDTTAALEEIAAANQDSAEILEAVEDRMHIIDKERLLAKLIFDGYHPDMDGFMQSLLYSDKFNLIDQNVGLEWFAKHDPSLLIQDRAKAQIQINANAAKSRRCMQLNRQRTPYCVNVLA